MIRFFFLITILVSFELNSSENQWSKLFSGKGISFFVDLSTLKLKEKSRSIKLLIDNKAPNVHGDYSSIINREFQCDELMYRDLEKDFYKLNLGKGKKSRGSGKIENSKWQYSSPGSASGEVLKAICNLK